MNGKRLPRPLLLVLLSLGAASCVSDDWYGYDEYDGCDGYGYYDPPPASRHWAGYNDPGVHRRGERQPPPERGRHEYGDRRDDGPRHGGDRHADDAKKPAATEAPADKAPKGFVLAGSFKSGGPVECGIPTSKKIRKVRLVGRTGKVSVNTVVLREGAAKTKFPVTRRIEPGQSAEIDLGGLHQATGLRISTGGKGEFDVYVK